MKTACAVLLACALIVPGCRRENVTSTDSEVTTTAATAAPSNTSSPIDLARQQIGAAMIKERDAVRSELVSRAHPSDPESEREWQEFRRVFPYHIQEIAVAQRHGDARTIIVAEPPPFVSLEDIVEAAGTGLVSYEVKKNTIGYDGWVKDVVLRLSGDDAALDDAISRLTYTIFRSSYKAHVLPLPPQSPHRGGDLDLDVTPAEIEQWLINEGETLVPVLGGQPRTVQDVSLTSVSRVFFSDRRGLVAWWIPEGTRIDTLVPEIRQFALDSDLIIGAIHRSGGTLVLARERAVPVDDLPPLRFETIALLAGVDGEARQQLAQSYERTAPFAGAISKRWDWAPILLSPELVDTEYGSLLNITDQLLKGWSNHGETTYKHFEKYPKPASYPFPGRLPDLLFANRAGQVTYNWNTTGVGYSVAAGDSEIFALYRTGALPVSYIPDGMRRSDPQVVKAEDDGYEYFARIHDPNLVRVVQYAALYQIFTAFDVRANAVPANNHPHELRKTIENELTAELESASEDDQEKLAQELAGRVVRNVVERIDDGQPADIEAMKARKLPEVREDLRQARGGSHRPMSNTLSAFAELRGVQEKYKTAGDTTNGWIHTPLVVLSTNTGKPKALSGGRYIVSVGGHNLYADRTRFEMSPDVPAGQPRVTEGGLQLNPRDAGKERELLRVAARDRRASMTTEEIAGDVVAAMHRIPEARPPRAQVAALKLGEAGDGGRGKPPHPPVRGRSTGDHGGGSGWEMNFGGGGHPPDGALIPGAIYLERRKDRTIHIVFEGGEAHAATAEDATDAVAQLMKNGKIGEEGVRLELRGFQQEDAHNFVRSCNVRSGAADAEISGLLADGRIDRVAAAEIRARQYDFSKVTVNQGEVTIVDGRPHAAIIVDIPRKGVAGSARTDITVGFHKETPQPVVRTLVGDIRAAIERIAHDQTLKLDAILFNLRLNREIKAISRKTGVPIDIVRQQFVDARHDLYFVDISLPSHMDQGEDERRRIPS